MTYEIVDVRNLTDEELFQYEIAAQLERVTDLPSRRDLVLRISGGVLAAAYPMLLTSNMTGAEARNLVEAIIAGGIKLSREFFKRKEPVRARFDLVNRTRSSQRKPVYNAIRSANLGITAQDYTYA